MILCLCVVCGALRGSVRAHTKFVILKILELCHLNITSGDRVREVSG